MRKWRRISAWKRNEDEMKKEKKNCFPNNDHAPNLKLPLIIGKRRAHREESKRLACGWSLNVSFDPPISSTRASTCQHNMWVMCSREKLSEENVSRFSHIIHASEIYIALPDHLKLRRVTWGAREMSAAIFHSQFLSHKYRSTCVC